MSRGVFVLGMHRSGTSAATRLVNLLGVPTCAEEDLFPATRGQPARLLGERVACRRSTTGSWRRSSPTGAARPSLAPGWEARPGARRSCAPRPSTLFAPRVPERSSGCGRTRATRVTLPFWQRPARRRAGGRARAPKPARDRGLARGARRARDRSTASRSGSGTLRTCLAAISGLPALVTTYDEILAAPLAVVRAAPGCSWATAGVANAAQWTPPRRSASSAPELRHAHFTPEDVADDPAVTSAQRELVRLPRRAASAPMTRLSLPDLSRRRRFTTEALLAERRRLPPARARVSRARRVFTHARRAVRRARAAVRRASAAVRRAGAEVRRAPERRRGHVGASSAS